MGNITFTIENEQDCNRITGLLEEAEIPYAIRKYSDSTFPSFGQGRPYAEITVDESQKDKLQTLFSEEQEVLVSNNVENPAPKKKYNILQIALIIYAVIATILLLKYVHLNTISTYSKNYHYQWNYNNTVLAMISKKTGKTLTKWFDVNYDFNYEFTQEYSNNGDRTEIFDFNEDGFNESVYYYNKYNQLVGKSFDWDADGVYDQHETILENKDTLVFTDKDANGWSELSHK